MALKELLFIYILQDADQTSLLTAVNETMRKDDVYPGSSLVRRKEELHL